MNLVEMIRRFGMNGILSRVVVWHEKCRVALRCLPPPQPLASGEGQRLAFESDAGRRFRRPVASRALVQVDEQVDQFVAVPPDACSALERIFVTMAHDVMYPVVKQQFIHIHVYVRTSIYIDIYIYIYIYRYIYRATSRNRQMS